MYWGQDTGPGTDTEPGTDKEPGTGVCTQQKWGRLGSLEVNT